jgi:FYVE/RhoGEF/PH domain-containing protein 3
VKIYRTRAQIAAEILSTEETYCSQLECITSVFVIPLRNMVATSAKVITNEELGLIFSNIDFILAINTEFIKKLKPVIQNYTPAVEIGALFLEIVRSF